MSTKPENYYRNGICLFCDCVKHDCRCPYRQRWETAKEELRQSIALAQLRIDLKQSDTSRIRHQAELRDTTQCIKRMKERQTVLIEKQKRWLLDQQPAHIDLRTFADTRKPIESNREHMQPATPPPPPPKKNLIADALKKARTEFNESVLHYEGKKINVSHPQQPPTIPFKDPSGNVIGKATAVEGGGWMVVVDDDLVQIDSTLPQTGDPFPGDPDAALSPVMQSDNVTPPPRGGAGNSLSYVTTGPPWAAVIWLLLLMGFVIAVALRISFLID